MGCFSKASEESVEFENYIRQIFGYNNVFLLCEGIYNGKGDIHEYRAYAGEGTLRYVGQFEPETFIESTYILNNDNAYYLAVYKDSELYLQNEDYFNSQIKFYDNDLAIIVVPSGEGWMPGQ